MVRFKNYRMRITAYIINQNAVCPHAECLGCKKVDCVHYDYKIMYASNIFSYLIKLFYAKLFYDELTVWACYFDGRDMDADD